MSSGRIDQFFRDKNSDIRYNEAINRIQQYQQHRLFTYELILYVIMGGISVNLLSTSIYDIFIAGLHYKNTFCIFIVTIITLFILFLLSNRLNERYLPRLKPDISIIFNLTDINQYGFSIQNIIHNINNGRFSEEKYDNWYKDIKERIINTDIVIVKTLSLLYEREDTFNIGKRIILKGKSEKVNYTLAIMISKFIDPIKPGYLTLPQMFTLTFTITNPEASSADEIMYYIYNYIIVGIIPKLWYAIKETLNEHIETK